MPPVNAIDPTTGRVYQVADASQVPEGWSIEGAGGEVSRLSEEQRQEEYSGAANKVRAGIAGVARGVTLGASDVVASGLGYGEELRNLREVNPGISLVTEAAGSLSGVGLAGRAAQLGKRIATVEEGASLAKSALRAGAGYGTEGALQGLGMGVSELALSDDPLTVERIGSALSSNVLLGGAIGGGAGILGKVAEKGLMRAKSALTESAERIGQRGASGVDDLATLDRKGLQAAKAAELDAVEAARVPQRAQVAEEIAAFRKDLKQSKVWLASSKSGVEGLETVGKRTMKADKALDNLLDDPRALAEQPRSALRHLRVQEAAFQDILNKGDELRAVIAADTSGTRAAALEKLPGMLERNRALQGKLAELSAPASSPRLAAIEEALAGGAQAAGPRSFADQLMTGAAYSGGAAAAGYAANAVGLPGGVTGVLTALVGAKAAGLVGSHVFGRLGKAVAENAGRTAKAIDTFLDVSRKVAPAAPVLASKVLAHVRYAQARDEKAAEGMLKLADSFRARAQEIRSQVAVGPTGKPVMRTEARMAMAANLDPIRVADPLLADRLETLAARRLEFLADKLPKRPELDNIQIGPDNWQPSEMEMRTFGRYAAAVEDPGGIEERLASGQTTPEDGEVMREVYPERYAAMVAGIVEKLPTLRANLPYARRLALSIFSGVPVDAAMNPRILSVLQSSYTTEEGTDGGEHGPVPKPAFGSVKSQDATPSEKRQGA